MGNEALEIEGIKPQPEKPLAPIRREKLEPEQIASIVMQEAHRINLLDVRLAIETREVSVFKRTEEREVVNVGDSAIIYGLYHRVWEGTKVYRDVFYDVVPINNLAAAYCNELNPKGIQVATARRAAQLAILIETYCRLFVSRAASTETALSVSVGLDGPHNKKKIR